MLSPEKLWKAFNVLDLKYANNPKNFWVVELADGIIQRKTGMLLNVHEVRSRKYRLIFCANDAFGAIGGLKVLNEKYGLQADAISGVRSSSPLHIRELSSFTDIPVFNNANPNQQMLKQLLVPTKGKLGRRKAA